MTKPDKVYVNCVFTLEELLKLHNLILSSCVENMHLSKEYSTVQNKIIGYIQEEV